MRLFLAGSWNAKEHLRAARTMCEEAGHEVTSTWLDEPPIDTSNPFLMKVMGLNDWHDVKRAGMLVMFREWESTSGGMFVEMGIALERGMPIAGVGKPNTGVYDHLPEVVWYDNLDELLEAISEKATVESFYAEPYPLHFVA